MMGGRVDRLLRRLRGLALGRRRGVKVNGTVRVGRRLRLAVAPAARLIVEDGVTIDDDVTIAVYGTGRVVLAKGVFVGHHTTLAAHEWVELGPGCFLAESVSIRDHDHEVQAPPSSGRYRVSAVRLGADVWLGSKVTVIRGSTVGDRAVVGANAVVRGELGAGKVYVGTLASAIEKDVQR